LIIKVNNLVIGQCKS